MYICTVGVVRNGLTPTTALRITVPERVDSSTALRGCAARRRTACGVGGTTLCCIIAFCCTDLSTTKVLYYMYCYILYCAAVLPQYHYYSAILTALSTPGSLQATVSVGNTHTSRYLPTLRTSDLPCTTPCHSCTSSPEVGGLLTHALPSLSGPCPLREQLSLDLPPCLLLLPQLARSPRRLITPISSLFYCIRLSTYLQTYSTYLIRYSISCSGQSTPHLPPAARRLAQYQNTSTSGIEIHACAFFTRETTSQP